MPRKSEFAGIVGAPSSDWDYHDRAGMVHLFEIDPPPPPSSTKIAIAQPSVRHRGAPRRGHVGARRRPGTRRVTASSRAGPRSDDPHQGDDDDEHRRAS